MAVSVYACITTRDGAIRNDVMGTFMDAVQRAGAGGIPIGAGRQQFNHGTAVCRNKAVADFLAHTKFSHLMFVDDDVLLPHDTITNLAETAARGGRDVVCGAYPTYKFAGPRKAYLYLTARPVGGDWLADWPDGEVEVDAGGTGCMMIRRDVFEAVGFPWFRWPEKHDPETGTVQWVSDDVDFCAAARHKGFRVWCDGRVRPGHLKLTDLKILMDGSLAWKGGSPPDPADAYGSHAGALRLLAKKLAIRSVVEYGSGRYSTPLFLDRAAFPDLERLHSIESSPDWFEDTRRLCGGDERLSLDLVPIDRVDSVDAGNADLVFIDCDTANGGVHDFSPRVKLIEKYQTHPAAVVAVHDANFASIRPAIDASWFKHKAFYVPSHGPRTAIMSNAVDVGALFSQAPRPA